MNWLLLVLLLLLEVLAANRSTDCAFYRRFLLGVYLLPVLFVNPVLIDVLGRLIFRFFLVAINDFDRNLDCVAARGLAFRINF